MSTEPNRSDRPPMSSDPVGSRPEDDAAPSRGNGLDRSEVTEGTEGTVRRAFGDESGDFAGQAASAEMEGAREAAKNDSPHEPPPVPRAAPGEHPTPAPTSVGGPTDQLAGQAASAEMAQATGADMTSDQTDRPVPPADDVRASNAGEPADEDENDDEDDEDEDDEDEGFVGHAEPIEEAVETPFEDLTFDWYILKVQVNREDSICDALMRRVQRAGLEDYFREIVVPTEDVVEFTKSGKKRTVKRKLYPGYIMVNMALTEDTWFLVRETPGIGDFTGSAGRPTPMDPEDVRRLIKTTEPGEEGGEDVRIAIPFNVGDRVRVKEGYFQNFEGDVESIDSANGRVTVMINIFGRSTPVELQHWQMERL